MRAPSSRREAIAAVVGAAILCLGCTSYSVGTPSDEHGKAYVVRHAGGREQLYLCRVENEQPVCARQVEQGRQP